MLAAPTSITAKPTPDNLLPLIERHRVTSFFAPPTVWISLLRSPLFDKTDLSSLKKGYYGASIMPVEVMREMAQRMPNVRLWNLYGQTEIAPLATMLGPEDQLRKPGSCGRAVLNVETRVVDDRMRDVKPGEVGEQGRGTAAVRRTLLSTICRIADPTLVARPRQLRDASAVMRFQPAHQSMINRRHDGRASRLALQNLQKMLERKPRIYLPATCKGGHESGAILTDDTQIRHTGESRCLWLTWVPACAGMTRTGGCSGFQMLDLYH